MKISILGCGWLGFPLGRELVKEGHEVKGSTTSPEKLPRLKQAGIVGYHLRLTPQVEGEKEFFDSELLIINLPPRNKDGQPDFHEKQLLSVREAALSHGVKQIIFISSTAVYPDLNRTVTEEDASEEALSRGGVPLLKMEHIFTRDKRLKTTVLRFGGLYGPDRHPGRFLAGKKELSGGDNPVNMIHLDDCIGIIKSIIDQEAWGGTFNACSPTSITRKAFYEEAAKELGLDPPHFLAESGDFKKVNSNKLIKTLNYLFQF